MKCRALPPRPLSFHLLLSYAEAVVPRTNLVALFPSDVHSASLHVQLSNLFLFFLIQNCNVQNNTSIYVQNRTSFTSNASKTFWVTFCELVLLTCFFKVASAPSKESFQVTAI